jgi:RNA polymerase sigma factor (sigma-70 family)
VKGPLWAPRPVFGTSRRLGLAEGWKLERPFTFTCARAPRGTAWRQRPRGYHLDVRDDPDEAILERLLSRDDRALQEVIDAHGAFVLGMARRVLGDPGLAEEVAQDAFLALWRRPGAFDPGRGSLRTFLLGVARNKAIDVVRKEERLRRTKEALTAEAGRQSEALGADEPMVSGDAVRSALADLPGAQREALVLAYFGGRTYREVAEELGIPEGTAKTRLRDGLANLRRTLGSEESRKG